MAKFTYRMQNILDIKIKMEDQAKVSYGLANARLLEEQQKLQAILLRRAEYEQEARDRVKGTLYIPGIKECRRAVDTMKSLQRAQMMQVHAAEMDVETARERLNQVMIERKTQEKLREKSFEEFKQELLQTESKEIDELVSYSYHEDE